MNNVAINICVHVFVWTYVFISFQYITRFGITGSYCNYIESRGELPGCVPKWLHPFAFLPSSVWGFLFLYISQNLLLWPFSFPLAIFLLFPLQQVFFFFKLKSMVYIRIHFLCFTFCGFWQLYNYICLPLLYHISFTTLKFPLLLYSYLLFCLSTTTSNHWSLYTLHSFVFSRMSYSWNSTVCSLFRLSFTQHYAFKVPPCLPGSLAHFFLAPNNIPLCECTTLCPLVCWRTSWLLPHFGNYE